MGLRDIESTLPAGFRFCPSDEELICHYLQKKVANERVSQGSTMVEVDLHTHEPWELPEAARLGENEWYFFNFRDRKYATGLRANRATKTGYWKATGKDRTVYDPATRAAVVGMRKTLVFYTGRAPNGTKSNWVMHEFRLETPHAPPKEDWVLCRVIHKKKGNARDYCSLESERKKDVKDGNVDSSSSPPHQQHQQGRVCYNYAQMTSQFPTVFGPQQQEEEEKKESNISNTFLSSALLLQHYDFAGGLPQELEKETATGVNCSVGGGDCGMMLDMGLEDYHDFYGGGVLGNFNGSSSSFQGGTEGHFFY